ncbi:ankyrin repeat domain-containing protein 13D isoform X5 [Mustela erminea]|uniref:ankyrin repeat domain-containing protein 13D isoform X5 n=1 Tax=Mustela erminea TaxID=36723 RepID=UPI0013873993|nr:ankyrin repeat domain-containing protein 13D isoform X5 [Mustela erminea]
MAGPGPTFPLHRLVWANRHRELEAALHSRQHDIEQEDPRGRTPLELAVSLGNLESVRVLLRHNANVGKESCQGWAVLQEAVSTGDPEMVQLVLQYRDYQRATQRLAGIPELLNKLRQAPDFYVEMKWEFTSWVPLVSKMCPSDVYRVWKRGESLRVDTSLLGFEHMTWQRGRRSFIFKGREAGALVMEVDHDRQVVHTETLGLALHEPEALLAAMRPSEEHVASRLTSPIVSTHLDTRNVAFERNSRSILSVSTKKLPGTNVVSGAGGLRRWKPLAATRPRQERLVVGAGVGDEAQELLRFSTSTHVEERQRSPWALGAWCGRGNSGGPECPGPAEHVGDHPSTGPDPGYRDDTRSAFPSRLSPHGSEPPPPPWWGARARLSLQRGGPGSCTGEAECGEQALSPQLLPCPPCSPGIQCHQCGAGDTHPHGAPLGPGQVEEQREDSIPVLPRDGPAALLPQRVNTSIPTSAWSRETSAAPLRCPAKCRGSRPHCG